MTLCWRTGMSAFIVVLGVSVAAFAEEPSPGTMKQDHQMGGMQQRGMPGMGMMKQDKQMGGMQGCMMMEDMMMGEMKDQQQLMREMKKHMRMMDEIMDKMMMQRQQGMTPPGSGSEPQEHHPGESK